MKMAPIIKSLEHSGKCHYCSYWANYDANMSGAIIKNLDIKTGLSSW